VFAVQRVRKLQGQQDTTIQRLAGAPDGAPADRRQAILGSAARAPPVCQDQAAFLAVSATFAVASLVIDAALAVASLTTWLKLV